MMKPIALYAMPRSKSTATMQACQRTIDLGEAWKPARLVQKQSLPQLHVAIDHLISKQQIDEVLSRIDLPDTKVKIIGHQLARLAAAQAWWARAQFLVSHDIFVLERSYQESLDSWLLAEHLGYFEHNQVEDREIVATEQHVSWVKLLLENHVRFYPSYGHRITWDALPPQVFDKQQIILKSQDSLRRSALISNLDWWHVQTRLLLQELQPQLDACRDSLPHWDNSK